LRSDLGILIQTYDNAGTITKELSELSVKINNGKGALTKLLTDEKFANRIDESVQNLKTTSAGFVTFTNKMNDKDGNFSKLMTDPYYTNSIKKSLSGLETSVSDINVFTTKLNQGNGILPKLISDEKLANTLDSTMTNLQTGSEKLLEIEEAAKHNFLLRGFFKNKKRQRRRKKSSWSKLKANDFPANMQVKIKVDILPMMNGYERLRTWICATI